MRHYDVAYLNYVKNDPTERPVYYDTLITQHKVAGK